MQINSTKTDNKQLVEIVAALAVIASLVFVGLQLMLDRKIAVAEIYANRAESLKSDYRTQLESENYIELQAKAWDLGERPSWWTDELQRYKENRKYTSVDVVTQILAFEIVALHYDNVYFQYTQGLLAEESWNAMRGALAASLTDPLRRAVFLFRQRNLRYVLPELLEGI